MTALRTDTSRRFHRYQNMFLQKKSCQGLYLVELVQYSSVCGNESDFSVDGDCVLELRAGEVFGPVIFGGSKVCPKGVELCVHVWVKVGQCPARLGYHPSGKVPGVLRAGVCLKQKKIWNDDKRIFVNLSKQGQLYLWSKILPRSWTERFSTDPAKATKGSIWQVNPNLKNFMIEWK